VIDVRKRERENVDIVILLERYILEMEFCVVVSIMLSYIGMDIFM